MIDYPILSVWTQCDCNRPHKKKAGAEKGKGIDDVMVDAEIGEMSFEDGEKDYRATHKEYRQLLKAEKAAVTDSPLRASEGTSLQIP